MDKEVKEVKWPQSFTPKRPFTYKKKKYSPEKKISVNSKELYDILSNKNLI